MSEACGGDCKLCMKGIIPVLDRCEAIGKAKHLLKELRDHDYLDDNQISKHCEYWDHENEEIADKLEDVRLALVQISSKLWEICETLDFQEEY